MTHRDTVAAVIGGFAAGVVLGAVQALALRIGRSHRIAWTVATTVGFSAGLALGATVVGFGTDATSLALMGVLTGAVTAQVISDTESRYANFGASGAVLATLAGGSILAIGRPLGGRSLHAPPETLVYVIGF